MGEECKILMVEFLNSLEMKVQRSEFKGKEEALFLAEGRGLIDQSCTKYAQGVAVDRKEADSRNRSIGRPGGRPTETVKSYK